MESNEKGLKIAGEQILILSEFHLKYFRNALTNEYEMMRYLNHTCPVTEASEQSDLPLLEMKCTFKIQQMSIQVRSNVIVKNCFKFSS